MSPEPEIDPLLRAQELGGFARGSHPEHPGVPLESCVTMEFEIAVLPSRVVKMKTFIDLMGDKLQLKPSTEIQAVRRDVADIDNLTLTEFDERVPFPVGFRSGTVAVQREGKTTSVMISFAQILGGGDTIRASVYSDSEDAELAVAKIYECLWEAAGQHRSWAEGRSRVHAKGYTTSSQEVLDCSVERLFSPGFGTFLRKLTEVPNGPAIRTGVHPIDSSTGRPEPIHPHVAVRFRQLHFEIALIDLDSGRAWTSPFIIAPKTRTTHGKGAYSVISDLPFADHTRLVDSLRKCLDEK